MQLLAIQVYRYNKCTVPAGERSRRRSPTAAAVKLIATPQTRLTPTGTKSSLMEPAWGWHSEPVTLWAHEGVLSGHNACMKCQSKIALVENMLTSFLISQFPRLMNCTTHRTSAVKELFLRLFKKKNTQKNCPQDYREVNSLSCRQQLVKQQEITYGINIAKAENTFLQDKIYFFKLSQRHWSAWNVTSLFVKAKHSVAFPQLSSFYFSFVYLNLPLKFPSFPCCPNPVNVRVVSPRAWRGE